MIDNALLYLLSISFIALLFSYFESKKSFKIFDYVPAVLMTYALCMFLASFGFWEQTQEITDIYKLTKTNLLPAMLFLMLIQIDIRSFFSLAPSLLIAYAIAISSLLFAFTLVFVSLGFGSSDIGVFATLSGSWMGGTANMLAISSALEVEKEALSLAIIVDTVLYGFWLMFLLSLVRFAPSFNTWTKSSALSQKMEGIGCACTIGPKRYYLFLALALFISLLSQLISGLLPDFLSTTSYNVIIATLFGLGFSFTRLKEMNGSSDIANTMLFMLIALIASRTSFEHFENIGLYVLAGALILLIHAIIMLIGAKLFKLDLFSIAVASLANIGGVASAPLLAATFHKSLIGVAVILAIMGYLIGTFAGLFLAYILKGIAG